MTLPLIPQDKANHYIYGNLIFLVVFVLSSLVVSAGLAASLALFAVAVAGIGKEIYDSITGTGTPEVMDAVYTITGGLSGGVVAIVLLY